jgi:putative peptidoglycan lipid II flippase
VALATTLSAWFNVLLLGGVLVRRGQLLPDRRLRERAPRLLMAAALMGLALLGAEFVLFPVASGPLRLVALFVLVGGGVAVYFGAALLMRGFDLRELHGLLRRRRTTREATA